MMRLSDVQMTLSSLFQFGEVRVWSAGQHRYITKGRKTLPAEVLSWHVTDVAEEAVVF